MATTTPPPATWRAAVSTPTRQLPTITSAAPAASPRPAGRRPRRPSSGLGAGVAIGVLLTLIVLVSAVIVGLVWREASKADPGADACQAMVDAWRAGVDADPWVYVQMQTSDDPRLQQAGAALQRWRSAPGEVTLDELLTAVALASAGCSAVGVDLPAEMLQFQPTS